MDAFSALLSALEDIIPMLLHVQCAPLVMTCDLYLQGGILYQHQVLVVGGYATKGKRPFAWYAGCFCSRPLQHQNPPQAAVTELNLK